VQLKHGAPSTLDISIGFLVNSVTAGDFFTTTLYVHRPLYNVFSREMSARFSKLLINLDPSLLSSENTLHSSVWNIPRSPLCKIVSKTSSIKWPLVLTGSLVEVIISDDKRLLFYVVVIPIKILVLTTQNFQHYREINL
jgi:hypothetical protein